MELFDICDENGLPTGETVERKEAHAKGIRHRTAHVWVIRQREGRIQVLLQKRAQNKDSFPGRFDTSSAGHIRAGDEPEPSALRELEEELGIRAKPEELSFAGTFRIYYDTQFYGKRFCDNEITFVYVYDRPVETDRLRLQPEEVEAAEWFDLEFVCRACGEKDPKFCVPRDGLKTLCAYLERKETEKTEDK